jgi:3',5'-cyclic-AMP phosphodiesterase
MIKREVNIIQLTDLHLLDSNNDELFNTKTNLNFKKVIEYITNVKKDYILITGDISHTGTVKSYEFFFEQINSLKTPVFVISGNHDITRNLHFVSRKSKVLEKQKIIEFLNWKLIFTDSVVPEKEYGLVSEKTINSLENKLNNDNKENIAIIMHHHPIPVNTPLIDNSIIKNHSSFLQRLALLNKLKLIICGHVHNDYSMKYKNIAIETAPATSFQFTKRASKLSIESRIGFNKFIFSENSYSSNSVYI